jgi:large subunit ribosomal protein L20
MARVKRGVTTHARHKEVIKLAKGFRGRSSTNFRIAIQKVEKALRYAYRDRRARKGEFRALWIQRINAGVRQYGMTYARFMHGLKLSNIELDRKQLSELAATEPAVFKSLVDKAAAALKAA